MKLRLLSLATLLAFACAGPAQEAPPPGAAAPAGSSAASSAGSSAASSPSGTDPAKPAQSAAQTGAQTATAQRFEPKIDNSLPKRTVFAGNPDYSSPEVSPDGKWITWLAPFEGVMNLWIAPFDAPEKGEALTQVKDRPLRMYFWAYDNKHVVYLKDSGGDENFQLHAAAIKDKSTRNLTDSPKTRTFVYHGSPKKPNELVIGLNDRDPKFHDVYKLDLTSGKRTLLYKNEEGYAGFICDDDLNLRLMTKARPDGGSDIFEVGKGNKLTPFGTIPMEDSETTRMWAFDATGKTLYLQESRGRNTAALVAYDMAKKTATVVAEDPRSDMYSVIFHQKTGRPLAASFNYDRVQWKAVDKAVEGDLAVIKKELRGDLSILSQSADDLRWTLSETIDDGSPKFYTFDRKAKKLGFLAFARKALDGLTLARMHPRVIKSRDNLDLVAYLSVPPLVDPDEDGKPEKPQPMVLLVHGGPWARDSWGFNPYDQWLTSRGYVVMHVNFRGSTGFGKSFINASTGEWSRKMHDDLIDTVQWAVQNGIADAGRVAIMGGSYGGYAVLAGLTQTPDTFACGVDIVGPSNLITLLETIPPYWTPILNRLVSRIGADHRTEEGKKFLAERSPLNFADRIKKPLLIGQGANDPRVKRSESDQIVKAMQEKNIPVTYVVFSDEGHGFARPENRLAFDAVAEAFLAACIGGTYQPIGDDFAGSTIAVPTGAGGVAGLADALKAAGASASSSR